MACLWILGGTRAFAAELGTVRRSGRRAPLPAPPPRFSVPSFAYRALEGVFGRSMRRVHPVRCPPSLEALLVTPTDSSQKPALALFTCPAVLHLPSPVQAHLLFLPTICGLLLSYPTGLFPFVAKHENHDPSIVSPLPWAITYVNYASLVRGA